MTDWEKMAVLIAISAAKNCIDVFEQQYPDDDRPRKALEGVVKWLNEPTSENQLLLEALETRVWRSKDWTHSKALAAAHACGCAARAARHPISSAIGAINSEGDANGIDLVNDYCRKSLYLAVHDLRRHA
jgi:hypothetical protein